MLINTLAARDEIQAAPRTDAAAEAVAIDESELIRELRRRDESAFDGLVRREGGRMLAAARRLLGNDHDAEDAVQEAFLQAYRAIERFAGEARLSTWLHRIVVNAALMKLRSRRRKPETPVDDLVPGADEMAFAPHPDSDWARSADEILESAESREIVRRSIDRLPEAYRRVLILREIEDCDTGETADRIGASTNAVKVRLHRARQALRFELERELAAG